MSDSTKDIERRSRMQEWFRSDPDIWKDILEEAEISLHNEYIKLAARTCDNREWSAGWVSSHKFLMSMGDWYRNKWTPPKEITKPQKQT